MEQIYRGRFLFFGTGYYNYDAPYTPDFPGIENFAGTVVHPQFWPESFDYAGKRLVVIGSGATAISMIPSLTKKAAQVTMLQRSPTYLMSIAADQSDDCVHSEGAAAQRLSCDRALVLQDRDHWQLLRSPARRRRPSRSWPGQPRADICPPATTSTPTSSRGTTRGTSGCA